MTAVGKAPALELKSASKEFYGVTVLDNVDLTIESGEIHALLGQNGSGKSTLIKILSGFHSPSDQTTLRIHGDEVKFPLSGDPLKHGMAFVHQNLGLADDLSVLDNLSFGEYAMSGGVKINWKAQRRAAASQMREFGIDADIDTEVGNLSAPSQKALIAIARAVTRIRRNHENGVLVLDEPTVYLPWNEVEHLHGVVRSLAASGVGVLYVTHRLDELRGFANRATVLRDGKRVGEVDVESVETPDLIEMITGSRIILERESVQGEKDKSVAMSVVNLNGARVHDVSFDVLHGEILGLAGLVGMGQEEVLASLFGVTPKESGEVRVEGEKVGSDPREAMNRGVGFLPSDRPRLSAAMTESVSDNITLPVLREFFFGKGRLNRRKEAAHVQGLMDKLDVRPRNPSLMMERLSGGNQQKALLGKWLQIEPKILLLDEPVQGVDVGARAQIFSQLRALASSGRSVVIASSEYEGLALLCDRVLVFKNGRVAQSLEGSDVTKELIAAACFGVDSENADRQ